MYHFLGHPVSVQRVDTVFVFNTSAQSITTLRTSIVIPTRYKREQCAAVGCVSSIVSQSFSWRRCVSDVPDPGAIQERCTEFRHRPWSRCGVTVSRSLAEHATHRQTPGTVPASISFSLPSEVIAFAFVVCTMILSRPLPLLVFSGVSLVRQGGKEISSTKTWLVTDDPLSPLNIEDYYAKMSYTRVSR